MKFLIKYWGIIRIIVGVASTSCILGAMFAPEGVAEVLLFAAFMMLVFILSFDEDL